jgi:hypothetical protein
LLIWKKVVFYKKTFERAFRIKVPDGMWDVNIGNLTTLLFKTSIIRAVNVVVKKALLILSLIFSMYFAGYAQTCQTPLIVDFSKSADTTTTITGSRSGSCCGGSNCITFSVKTNAKSDLINFTPSQSAGSAFYTVNCGAPIPAGTPACITGLGVITISFCKPGNNSISYTITASKPVTTSSSPTLRRGCSGTMSVNGLITSTISWTSIFPGAAGTYNSYLDKTSNTNSVTVTPAYSLAASVNYIDYKVTGDQAAGCSVSDTIRVYVKPQINASVTPLSPTLCPNSTVVLTATASGGVPPLTYRWSTGATSQSITVSTAGVYTVSVADQLPNCGTYVLIDTVKAYNNVAPTATGAYICTGSKATLKATAPGGPYQWYDAPTNGNLLYTGTSFTTPILTANTMYYVQTALNGCTSNRTAVSVTVDPLPAKPGISSQ